MMGKKELEVTLEKNLLDLEYSRHISFYVNCLVLSTTLLSVTFSLITFLNWDISSRWGLTVFIIGSSVSAFLLIKAYEYHQRYRENLGKIQALLDRTRNHVPAR